ncbi:hypothetical protein [Novosphingobium rhizosphaerae]|uniref:hypothetical protein n=1 Tax=Novosphingobium rhizosphaerae TaxID=1551649 RepID=UPI003D813539
MLGYYKLNKYRVLGYIGQLNYDFSLGKIRVGGWYEYADTDRARLDLDRTTGLLPTTKSLRGDRNGHAAQRGARQRQLLQYSKWNQYSSLPSSSSTRSKRWRLRRA